MKEATVFPLKLQSVGGSILNATRERMHLANKILISRPSTHKMFDRVIAKHKPDQSSQKPHNSQFSMKQ